MTAADLTAALAALNETITRATAANPKGSGPLRVAREQAELAAVLVERASQPCRHAGTVAGRVEHARETIERGQVCATFAELAGAVEAGAPVTAAVRAARAAYRAL